MVVTRIEKPVRIYADKIVRDIALVIKEGLRIYLQTGRSIKCPKCKKTFQHGIKAQNCIYCGNDLTDEVAQEISEIMYKIYNKDLSIKHYFSDIYKNELNMQYEETLVKLNSVYISKLIKAREFLKTVSYPPAHNAFIETGDGWIRLWYTSDPRIYSMTQNQEVKQRIIANLKRRMYLNVDPQYFDKIIETLCHELRSGSLHNYTDKIMFKFADPNHNVFNSLIRAEKLVIYYSNEYPLNNALTNWAKFHASLLRQHAPLFTTDVIPGVGLAYEPLPEHHEYHIVHSKDKDMASFGSFITLNVARYLYGWILQHKKIPNDTEILQIAKDVYYHKILVKHKFPFA